MTALRSGPKERGEEHGEVSEGSGEGEGEGVLVSPPHQHQGTGRVAEGGTRGSGGGAWRPRSQHASPFGHFPEHVAGSDVGKVERRFGPLPGRIRHWAINKVCSPRSALRFLFKVPGHLSFVTADN
jgi:hypothetical protein